MFESCWAHHSTRLHLAVGETKSRSWRVIRHVECPERASRVEGRTSHSTRSKTGARTMKKSKFSEEQIAYAPQL